MSNFDLELSGGYKKTSSGNDIWYYGGGDVAWASLAAAKAGIPSTVRSGRTVGVLENDKVVEYIWHPDNITDEGLVIKSLGGLVGSDFVRSTGNVTDIITGIKVFLDTTQFDGNVLFEENVNFAGYFDLDAYIRFKSVFYYLTFTKEVLTADRTITLPNKSGTVALIEEITKAFIDALGIDADTLDGLNSTDFLKDIGGKTLSFIPKWDGFSFIDSNIEDVNGGILVTGQTESNSFKGEIFKLLNNEVKEISLTLIEFRDRVLAEGGTIESFESIPDLGLPKSVLVFKNNALGIQADLPVTKSGTIALLSDIIEETGSTIAVKLFTEDNINQFTDDEKSKLATVESSKWLGEYTSLTALNTAHPSPNPPGSYANVDGGVGADVKRYLWDVTDDAFVIQEGTASNITSAEVKSLYEANADTNAFTTAEQSKLASITAIFTTALKTAYDNAADWITTHGTNLLNHLSNTSNPHSVNKTDVGLGNVPNLDTTNAVNKAHDSVTLTGTPNYLTIVGQNITRGLIDLANHVTNRLSFDHLPTGTAQSVVGRSGSGNGDLDNISAGNNTILSRLGSGNVSFNSATETKQILSLENVNNTSDANKPISTATQTALDLKANQEDVDGEILDLNNLVNSKVDSNDYQEGIGINQFEWLSALNLDEVDNTSDADKPISTATQTALNGTAKLNVPNTFTQQQLIDGNLSIPLVLSKSTHKAWVFHRPSGVGEEGVLIFAPNLTAGSYVDSANVDWAKQIKFDDGVVEAIGFRTTTAATGFLKADGSVDASTYMNNGEVISISLSVANQIVEANTGVIAVVGFSASTVLTDSLRGKVASINSSTNVNITVNQNSLGNVGDVAYIDQTGLGEITIVAGTGTVNLRKNSSVQLVTDGQYSRVAIHKVSATDYRVFGELKPL